MDCCRMQEKESELESGGWNVRVRDTMETRKNLEMSDGNVSANVSDRFRKGLQARIVRVLRWRFHAVIVKASVDLLY